MEEFVTYIKSIVGIDDLEIADEPAYDEDETQLKVEAIKLAMNELPDGYRVVLTLYLFEGYDHEEIGNVLKISETTSRTQYLRGKKRLLELL